MNRVTFTKEGDWVALDFRFTPGWPWPESSYGLDPMYGEDGWCHECGTPLRPQIGPLTIQGSGFPKAEVWIPNWRYDSVCVSGSLAEQLREHFDVQMRDVHKPRHGATGVQQLIPSISERPWYAKRALSKVVLGRHSKDGDRQTGSLCPACGNFKWLPVNEDEVTINPESLETDADVVASCELFGAGKRSFRHVLFRRDLAELLVEANPRTFSIREVEMRRRRASGRF